MANKKTNKPQERQGIIKRLIETLKRVIGHKKGERDEVRYNNKEGHKNWVYKEKGENVSAFGLTHSGETFGRKNMPLTENPDPKDKSAAYIRNGVIKGKKSSFANKPKKGMKFSKSDKTNMKSKRRYHEKERKRQAAKKKAKQKSK